MIADTLAKTNAPTYRLASSIAGKTLIPCKDSFLDRLNLLGITSFFNQLRRGQLCQGNGQAADGVLILLVQHPVADQNLFFYLTQIIDLGRGRAARQYIEHVHTARGNARQIIRLGRTISIFILALGVGLDTTDFAKNFLRQTKPLSLLPQAQTNSTHLDVGSHFKHPRGWYNP